MTKKLIILLISLLTAVYNIKAEEKVITLEKGKAENYTADFYYGKITFKLDQVLTSTAKVDVVIENTKDYDILIFGKDITESALKQCTPKIEFSNKMPGNKNQRIAIGTPKIKSQLLEIRPQISKTIFTENLILGHSAVISVPVYVADIEINKKTGEYKKLKIWKKIDLAYVVEVIGWTPESDPDYFPLKASIDSLDNKLKKTIFCNHKDHDKKRKKGQPTYLEEEERPYIEEKAALSAKVDSIFDAHSDWMSEDNSYQHYMKLKNKLDSINIQEREAVDPSHNHGTPPPVTNCCKYTSWSSQQVLHLLQDTYQSLRAHKIDKQQALNNVKAAYTCYTSHKTRKAKKDKKLDAQIEQYYKKIMEY